MQELEQDIKQELEQDMRRLSDYMRLFKDMKGSYAFRRSQEIYEELSKIYSKLND